MFRGIRSGILLASIFSLLAISLTASDLDTAEDLYKHTEYDQSLASLNQHSTDPATIFLIGRDYFGLGNFKKSVEFFQRATAAAPNNAEYWDWLGRAYGRRAETSNMFTAPGFATKARDAFEKSVSLDPSNKDALADLFDYYLEAPGFLGGGHDKALAVVEKTSKIDPPEAYFERARIAQKQKEYESAELHLRKAVAAAPREVGHLLTLARFLATQGRVRESDQVFAQAEKIAPNDPKLWYARADVLIKTKRNPDEARDLLEKYVKASITVDDPPKTDALRLLKQVGGV